MSNCGAHDEPQYDLEERTSRFGKDVIALAKRIPVSPVTRSLVDQLVRAGTSVGANYAEANEAQSKRDFRHKITLCRKEAHETRHWLTMVVAAGPRVKESARILWQEAKELTLIFAAIARTSSKTR